ncbi:glycosyltransferase family 2 protein [Winogradskyella sp. PE311]|uniref:glycosyltransferase family 2 protein n=1 Tax=Winogradskyella sp. PE311 TaxID=3366943 RepID=UPI003980A0C2
MSIITINYNDSVGLMKTMESVQLQSYRDFEHVIIDGDSNDNSLEVIKSFNYDNLNYISEPDSGIYNAMNKGIAKAKGKFLLFLNSGDILENNNVISNVIPYLSKDYSVLAGDIIFNEDEGMRLREHPEQLYFSYLVGNAISHPSTFIKNSLFNTYGNYNENLKIVSDWAFFLKVLGLNNETYFRLPLTISIFDTKGVSSREENFSEVYKERHLVLESYFPRIFNNENDTYVFNKFISKNKRFKYLKVIDSSPFFRKLATLQLGISARLIRFFSSKE